MEDGRAVEHVDASNVQHSAVSAEEFNDREADRVGTSRGARGEDSMRPVIGRRRADQLDSIGAVEHPDDEEVREAFNVSETALKFRLNLKHAFGLMLRAQAFGNLLRARMRASDKSNRLWREHLMPSYPV